MSSGSSSAADSGVLSSLGQDANRERRKPKPSSLQDRFIPSRGVADARITCFEIAQAQALPPQHQDMNASPAKEEYKRTLASKLFQDVPLHDQRILAFSGRQPQQSTEPPLRLLYNANREAAMQPRKHTRHIPQSPERILDAPDLLDDYYLNLLDWNAQNILEVEPDGHRHEQQRGPAVGRREVQAAAQHARPLRARGRARVEWPRAVERQPRRHDHAPRPPRGAAARSTRRPGGATACCRARLGREACPRAWAALCPPEARPSRSGPHWQPAPCGRRARVPAPLASRLQAQHSVATLHGHQQEVCGLKWAPGGVQLASGGNDNLLNIWDERRVATAPPVFSFDQHHAAVKALAWCPWQKNLLASGGGTADRMIRFWNTNNGAFVNAVDTHSQVCALQWSMHDKEIVSSHGFSHNQLILWKYPHMVKASELTGHTARVLHLAQSPDGTTVVSAAADETLRFWKILSGGTQKTRSRGSEEREDSLVSPSAWTGSRVVR